MSSALKQYCQLSDSSLLQLIQQKDADAFEVLYDRYARAVYNLLLKMMHNPASAEDLLQETFWQVWQKAEQYEGKGAPLAWLMRIARHKAIDALRRQKAWGRMCRDPLDSLETVAIQHSPSLEMQVEQLWSSQLIAESLHHIPMEQCACLELIYCNGLTHRQVAEQMQTPLGTIKTRVRSGLAKIKHYLRGVGYSEVYA